MKKYYITLFDDEKKLSNDIEFVKEKHNLKQNSDAIKVLMYSGSEKLNRKDQTADDLRKSKFIMRLEKKNNKYIKDLTNQSYGVHNANQRAVKQLLYRDVNIESIYEIYRKNLENLRDNPYCQEELKIAEKYTLKDFYVFRERIIDLKVCSMLNNKQIIYLGLDGINKAYEMNISRFKNQYEEKNDGVGKIWKKC